MRVLLARAALAALVLGPGTAGAQDISDASFTYWGFQAERVELRVGEDEEVLAAEGDAFYGTDDLKLRWEFEAEYGLDEEAFEALENQVVLQTPISDFFDAKAGVGLSSPEGPDRFYGVVGVHGLAPQWFEIDADARVSETGDVAFLFEAEYEALITNRIILTPAVELEIGATDDNDLELGKGFRSIELGARLSYDLLDRAVAPYIGVHYERLLGETANIAEAEGEDEDALFAVIGVRLMF